jgi:hypothetical protein
MNTNEMYAKLIALSVLYEKDEQTRQMQVQNIMCDPNEIKILLNEISDEGFRNWVQSVSHLFKHQ